jgi:hypothetical protein
MAKAAIVVLGEDGYWRIPGQPPTTYFATEADARRVAREMDSDEVVPACDDDDDEGGSLSDEEADADAANDQIQETE